MGDLMSVFYVYVCNWKRVSTKRVGRSVCRVTQGFNLLETFEEGPQGQAPSRASIFADALYI